ncbi:MAG: hypothetical protein AB7G47_19595 [Mycolicibacterium sp.]|uniref:hypothetical protein n=1 Tax=Mycolicibacterium sp. TaxID=2320850 RepID=UPI003D0D157A
MRVYTTAEIEQAQTLIASADREFADYSRTDLLLDNMRSLRNVEDARGLLTAINADLRSARHLMDTDHALIADDRYLARRQADPS